VTTIADPPIKVSEQKRIMRRGDLNPIWNIFTHPEINDFRRQMKGTTVPMRTQVIIV
jgi:hypothetical protein